jgi:hypothetical protein
MAKLMVYVPEALKRRMAKIKGVKWSPIACAAFEGKLGELAARKETKNMQDVIDRLRASNMADLSEKQSSGSRAGREWAKSKAEAAELKRLQRALDVASPNQPEPFVDNDGSAHSGAEVFVFTIRPEFNRNRAEANDFWSWAIGDDDLPEGEFVQAFAEGAVEVWQEVQDKL